MQLPNELIWLIFLITDMLAVIAVYRWFGKAGLMAYIVMAIITCNLQVQMLVPLFGFTVTLGNILYGSIFLCTDLLSEVHGKKDAQKAVWLGFVAIILLTIFMRLTMLYQAEPFDQIKPHLTALFNSLPRIVAGSLIAYLVSQFHDVWAFHWIKDLTKGRKLWLRNNAATMVSQAFDITIFSFIAFAPLPVLGVVPGFESWSTVIEVWWTAYAIKFLVAVFDTPFVYWGRSIGRRYLAQTAA